MREMCIPSLGREDPLEEEMGTSLENSMHRGAWWATVHGVAKELDIATKHKKLYVTLERGKTFHRLTQH